MNGVTLRHARAEDARAIARVRVDSWRTTYRGLVPQRYLDAMTVEASEALWTRVLEAPPARLGIYVGEREGTVVGFAAGNMLGEPKLGFDAELTAVYLIPEAQRAGLGRRLVATVASTQRGFGATGLIAWVIAGNSGARAFYEALGGRLLVEQPFEWDGMELVEAAYGFADLRELMAAGGLAALN